LTSKPELAARIEGAKQILGGRKVFRPEADRVRKVLLKLARGHAAFELNEPQLDEPVGVLFEAFENLSQEVRDDFERPPETRLFPEVGSRALQRLLITPGAAHGDWIDVQEGRYRYMVSQASGLMVRMVIREYLACEIVWD
jgi:hypothetical protein